jgi:hypothetical protein
MGHPTRRAKRGPIGLSSAISAPLRLCVDRLCDLGFLREPAVRK